MVRLIIRCWNPAQAWSKADAHVRDVLAHRLSEINQVPIAKAKHDAKAIMASDTISIDMPTLEAAESIRSWLEPSGAVIEIEMD